MSLRLKDIAVLLDLGLPNLIARKKPRFPAPVVEARPGLRALEDSFLWRTLPVLGQVGPERRCIALTPNLRCSLYPNWPTSCERFPYTLTADRKRVTWGTRCPSRRAEPNPARAQALFLASVEAYNERIRDAVLIQHARKGLADLGIAEWLCFEDEYPFE